MRGRRGRLAAGLTPLAAGIGVFWAIGVVLVLLDSAAGQTKIDLARQAQGKVPLPISLEYLFAGVTQNGNAGWYVSSGSSNIPTVTEVSQTAPYAVLVFGPCTVCNGSDDVTGYLWLPKIAERWDGAAPKLAMRFRTSQTSQAFTIEAVSVCAAAGTAGNPTSLTNTAGVFSLTSPSTANQWFDQSVASLNVSGCDPQEALWIRIQRTDNNAGDLAIVWSSLTMGVTQ